MSVIYKETISWLDMRYFSPSSRAPALPFLSRLKLPFPFPPNACHAGYVMIIKDGTDDDDASSAAAAHDYDQMIILMRVLMMIMMTMRMRMIIMMFPADSFAVFSV